MWKYTRHNMLAWLSFTRLERFLLWSQDLVNPKRRRVQWRFKTAKEILVKSVMRCFWGLVNTIRANHFQSGSVAPPHQLKGCNSCQINNSNRQFIINNQWPTIHNQWLLHSSKIAHSDPEADFWCTLYKISRTKLLQKKIKNFCHKYKYLVIKK